MGVNTFIKQLFLYGVGGQAPPGAASASGDMSQMIKYIASRALEGQVRLPGVDFPFAPGSLTGLSDITIGANTDWSAQADRIKLCDVLTIETGWVAKPTKGGIIVCRKLVTQAAVDSTKTVSSGLATDIYTTTFTVGTPAPELATGMFIRIDNEVMEITNIVTNDITVRRGRAGTARATHANGTAIFKVAALDASGFPGSNGGNASGGSPGGGGAGGSSTTHISPGGTGGNGALGPNVGQAAVNGTDVTQDTGQLDLTPASAAVERALLAAAGSAPSHANFGWGGRGGGGGGGGGGESSIDGGAGGDGGDATGYLNAAGGAFGAGSTGNGVPGSNGSQAAHTAFNNDLPSVFGQVLFWLTFYGLGTGGGGGGGGGGDTTLTLAAGGGGGGGDGAAPLLVICDELDNQGYIAAAGGHGGKGGNASSSATDDTGGGGGGAGGGGAVCAVAARSVINAGTIQAPGGTAGVGGQPSSGNAGAVGGNGADGRPGIAILLRAA